MNFEISNDLKQGCIRDLCLEEVHSFKFGMKDILTVTRSSLKGEEQQIFYTLSQSRLCWIIDPEMHS